jgi:hypothetical protein
MKLSFIKVAEFLRNEFIDKWRLIYLYCDIDNFSKGKIKVDSKLKIFLATDNHLDKIKEDLYPYFDSQQNYFKKFIEDTDKDVLCYVCQKDEKFVHYFLVFLQAKNSPLMKTPFNKKDYPIDDCAYLGNAFTIPEERGGWIVLQVLGAIMKDLKDLKNARRALVLIHPKTRGALRFYKNLGFKVI